MPVVRCPKCHATARVPAEIVGRNVRCPRCQQAFTVVAPAPVAPAFSDSDLDSPTPAPGIVRSSFIKQNLMPGEQLIAVTHMHPMVIVAPCVMMTFFLLLGLAGLILGSGVGGFVISMIGFAVAVVASIMLVMTWIQWLTTEYSSTDKRILIKSGLLVTQLREMPLAKVEALLVTQGVFGKLFGYGTLVFKGSGGTKRRCDDIEEPFDFYKRIQEQVARVQTRM